MDGALAAPGVGGRGRGPRRLALRGAQAVAAMLSACLLVAFGYGFYNLRDLTSHQQTLNVGGLGEGPSGAGGVRHVDGAAQNILVVGLDSRAGLSTAQQHHLKVGTSEQTAGTDTIIVVHVPANGDRATLLSIPRDTYVNIPGFAPDKINAAYIDGYDEHPGDTTKQDEERGTTLLVRVVKQLTGLSIDHYVQVGFGGFVNVVRALDGVPVDLCDSVDDTHAHNQRTGVGGGSGFHLTAGHHVLTPQQALEFVRQRHNLPGPVQDDLGREARQRYFVKQAFAKIATAGVLLDPIKLKHLIGAVDGALTFDQQNFGILQFAEQMSQLTAGNITGRSIPITGYPTIDDQSVVSVNVAQVHRAAHRLFYGTRHPHPATPTGRHRPAASGGTDPAASGCIY